MCSTFSPELEDTFFTGMMKERSSQVNERRGRNPLSNYYFIITVSADVHEAGVKRHEEASGHHKKESVKQDKECGKNTRKTPTKLVYPNK